MSDTPSGDPVARYYDSNTRRFLAVGGGGSSYSIHRQLWGPGVRSTREAADYVNRLLAERIEACGAAPDVTILDMGCGVGGTLLRLAESFPRSRLHGITISPRQRAIAARLLDERGMADRCAVYLGDFQSADLDVEADVIVAVESFVHAASPERFFAGAARHLKAGGHVLLADDFLRTDAAGLGERQRRQVADFQAGWRAPALCTVERCTRAASEVGLELVVDEDLTALIRLGRPRDAVISVLGPAFRRLGLVRVPFFGNMIGGGALQVGLGEGFLQYRLLDLRSDPSA